MKEFFRRVSKIWTADLRSLALFRMGLGLLVIADVLLRAQPEFFTAFHTDAGVLSRSFLISKVGDASRLTPHLMTGTATGMIALFLIEAFCGCMLLLGWRTRLMTVACWVLTLGLQNRNPLVLQGGDVFFRLLLLVGIFLPIGARFSIDRLRLPETKENDYNLAVHNNSIISAATLFLLVQVILVYVFSGLIKWHYPAWKQGLGVYYAFSSSSYATSFGLWLSQQNWLMRILNWCTLGLEIVCPLLLLFQPVRFGKIRAWTVAGFIVFHLSITMTLYVGLFSWICIVAWVSFLPPWFWEQLSKIFPRPSWKGFVLQYSAYSDCCRRYAIFVARLIALPRDQVVPYSEHVVSSTGLHTKFLSGQVELSGQHLTGVALPTYLHQQLVSTWRIHSNLRWLVAPLSAIVKSLLVMTVFGARTFSRYSIPLPYRERSVLYGSSYLSQVLCLLALWIALLFNFGNLPQLKFNPWVKKSAWTHMLGLNQRWGMFSKPLGSDGWFVFPARLADGSDVDLFRDGAPLTYEPPSEIATMFKGDRWRKYMSNLRSSRQKKHRLPFGRYLCRSWNKTHSDSRKLEAFKIIFMQQKLESNGSKSPIKRVQLWRHECVKGMLKKWEKSD